MTKLSDPIGEAIKAYSKDKKDDPIIIQSDLCEDDEITPSYLFRSFVEMPVLVQKALQLAKGKVLDVGACAGCHSVFLVKQNLSTVAIDVSPGSIAYLQSNGIEAIESNILDFKEQKFDTILLLMNGLGLAQTLKQLPEFLKHLKSLLSDGGSILCDSTDIKYLYEDEEGAIWMDLNSSYYGEMKFNMVYNQSDTGWFNWLYVDQDTLKDVCENIGLNCNILYEGENSNFLAEIK